MPVHWKGQHFYRNKCLWQKFRLGLWVKKAENTHDFFESISTLKKKYLRSAVWARRSMSDKPILHRTAPCRSKFRFKNNAASFEENAPELKQLAFAGQTYTTHPANSFSYTWPIPGAREVHKYSFLHSLGWSRQSNLRSPCTYWCSYNLTRMFSSSLLSMKLCKVAGKLLWKGYTLQLSLFFCGIAVTYQGKGTSSLWEWRNIQQNVNCLLRPRTWAETRKCSRLFTGLYSIKEN